MKKIRFIILIVVFALCGCSVSKSNEIRKEIPDESKVRHLEMVFVGDMIFHMPIINSSYDKENSYYNFEPIFSKVKNYIGSADIAVANFEGSINSKRKFSGFPTFNFPTDSVKSLKNVGFDILSTANNHSLDMGENGIIETIDTIENNGLKNFGSYKSYRNNLIVKKNDIKIGFISFTQSLNGMDGLLSKDKKFMINRIDFDQISNDIDTMRNLGVDFIVAYPHFGDEYQLQPNDYQKEVVEFLLSKGVDIICGSHPHVLQKSFCTEKFGKRQFVIYSMGNFLSNQRIENLNRNGVDTGVMIKIYLSKDLSNNKKSMDKIELRPTYVNRYRKDNKFNYEIIDLKSYLDTKPKEDNFTKLFQSKYDFSNNILEFNE